jgi:histidyl-tRNA synthetase
MSRKYQAPRGTFDILPDEQEVRERIERTARDLFGGAGYGRIETPAFEDTELFARGVGESTDIVRKEMFTFEDQGGRSVTLRPEATAPICRAYVEHGMHKLPQPVKLWCAGPFFRYEAPQAGRFRQFNQIDAEVIGSDSPLVDAELIMILDDLLSELGVPGVRLLLSSLGSPEARATYREDLKGYLRSHESELSREVRERIDANPLRAFDSDDERTRAVMTGAPTMLDRLDGEDAEHFTEVRRLLDQAGVEYALDGTLVRGLDYYTRTVFEFSSDALGAQSGVGGGGRYDGLIEQIGGPHTPGIGWASGVERILLTAAELPAAAPPLDLYVAYAAPELRAAAFRLAADVRRAGLAARLELGGRSLKGQLKQADRADARYVAILGDEGTSLKDMETGEQRTVEPDTVMHFLGQAW